MLDWIKSFIVACLAFVALFAFGAGLMLIIINIHPLIIIIVILAGILAALTIIMHGKPQESSK